MTPSTPTLSRARSNTSGADIGDDAGPALGQLRDGQAAHGPHDEGAGIGTGVAEPGDLALVGQDADEPAARAGRDLLDEGERLGGSPDRAAARSQVHATAGEARGRAEGRIDLDAQAHGRAGAGSMIAERGEDQVDPGGRVDDEGEVGQCVGVGGESAEGAAVDRRIGDEDVAESAPVEIERLREGEGEEAAVAVGGEDPVEDGGDPHGFRRDADRQSARAPAQSGDVAVEGGEVDDPEGAVHPGDRSHY